MSGGLRIVVSAYACEPGRGSEPGVGWNWVRQIARHNQAWVITRHNNRAPIERALASEPLPGAHFVYYDLPRWMRWWKRGGRGLYLYYYLWQAGAFFQARALHRDVRFQVAHHVTFVTYWLPSFFALLPIPFLWGPVGGGEAAPRSFQASFSLRGRAFEWARSLIQNIARLDPFLRMTARRSALALASTPQTAARLKALGCRRVAVYSSMGMPSAEIEQLGTLAPKQGTFRIAGIADLLHWKGAEFGLRAFAQFAAVFPDAEYWLIGEGPERRRLEKLSQELGIAAKVSFWGQLPRAATLARLSECDILLHPSLHDSGGCVCAEAMAAGRPVVCFDLGGPALQVTDATGIRIPAVSPRQSIEDLTQALCRLAGDGALRSRMSDAAKRHVRESLHWDLKGDQLAAMYRDLTECEAAPAASKEIAMRTVSAWWR